MAHPKDNEIYPIETVVRILDTNEFAIIKKRVYRYEGPGGFMHYEGIIEGRGDAHFILYHDRVELEVYPSDIS